MLLKIQVLRDVTLRHWGGGSLELWRETIPSSGVKQFKMVHGDSSWTHSENESTTFCRNVGNNLPNETTASQSRRTESSIPVLTYCDYLQLTDPVTHHQGSCSLLIYTRQSRLFQVILSIMLQLCFLRPFSVASSAASTKWMLISHSE
jgi:hypothetical protein